MAVVAGESQPEPREPMGEEVRFRVRVRLGLGGSDWGLGGFLKGDSRCPEGSWRPREEFEGSLRGFGGSRKVLGGPGVASGRFWGDLGRSGRGSGAQEGIWGVLGVILG